MIAPAGIDANRDPRYSFNINDLRPKRRLKLETTNKKHVQKENPFA